MTMYLVLAKNSWDSVSLLRSGVDASFTFGPDMGVAFCPLFSTREEAEEHWPGREIIKVVTSDGDKV